MLTKSCEGLLASLSQLFLYIFSCRSYYHSNLMVEVGFIEDIM